MAGKGGGAWKVAYADFVTAMMAFFLVMWIVTQDKKIKEAVSHYFVDPMGYYMIGSSSQPGSQGAMFDAQTGGTVPGAQSLAMGRGRQAYSDPGPPGPATKMVADWLLGDDQAQEEWRDRALRSRARAADNPDVKNKKAGVDEVAARELAQELRAEIVDGMPKAEGVYQDLIFESLDTINWTEIAEDLLSE